MDTAPVDKAPPARRGNSKPPKQPRRGEKMLAEGKVPLMHPIGEDLEYMVGYLYRAGLCSYSAGGCAPLSSSELLAWQNGSQTTLSPWEFQTLLDMSSAYVQFLNTAEDPACPPPYGELAQVYDRDVVAKKLRAALGGWGKKGTT